MSLKYNKGINNRKESLVKRWTFLGFKILVTTTLCWWIISKINVHSLIAQIKDTNLYYIGVAIALILCGIIISAIKWHILLEMQGEHYSLWLLIRWYFISFFLSQFLPSIIGGDTYRIYKTCHNGKSGKINAILAVATERLTGFIALCAIGFIGSFFIFIEHNDTLSKYIVCTGSILISLGLTIYLLAARYQALKRLTKWRLCPKTLVVILNAHHIYCSQKTKLTIVWIISFVFHFTRVTTMLAVLYALGKQLNIIYIMLASAAVTIVGMLPISIGGLGIMEGSLMSILWHYGVPKEIGLTTMLLLRILTWPICFIGAIFYLQGDRTCGKNSKRDRVSLIA